MPDSPSERGFVDVFILEPWAIVKQHPHQVLLSFGSVTILSQFAAAGGVIDQWTALAVSIGFEWAYLRGLSDTTRERSWWSNALNWSAFVIVVLWGMLGVLIQIGTISAKPDGGWAGIAMAAAHVVPIAWLSLCAAMAHRTAHVEQVQDAKEDAKRAQEKQDKLDEAARLRTQAIEDQERAWKLEQAGKDAEVRRWEQSQETKQRLTLERQAARKQRATGPATAGATGVPQQVPQTNAGVPRRVTIENRELIKAQIAEQLREAHARGENVNVSAAARALDIPRPTWQKLRNELEG